MATSKSTASKTASKTTASKTTASKRTSARKSTPARVNKTAEPVVKPDPSETPIIEADAIDVAAPQPGDDPNGPDVQPHQIGDAEDGGRKGFLGFSPDPNPPEFYALTVEAPTP